MLPVSPVGTRHFPTPQWIKKRMSSKIGPEQIEFRNAETCTMLLLRQQ